MAQPDTPKPVRWSKALLCLCVGLLLVGLAWYLGVGGTIGALFKGGAPAAGGLIALVLVPLTGVAGAVLASFGAVWLIVRALSDQRQA